MQPLRVEKSALYALNAFFCCVFLLLFFLDKH